MTRTERITFESKAEQLVGTLYLPDGAGKWPALVTDGPLTSVKEQATGNHARAMAERGFVALAFDHRFFGESGGLPRQYESPPEKIEDRWDSISDARMARARASSSAAREVFRL